MRPAAATPDPRPLTPEDLVLQLRSALSVHRAVRRSALVGSLLALAACAGAPKPRQLGDYPVFGPRLTVIDSQRPPVDLTIDLAQPASVAVLFVVPGRGTLLVYPSDTTTSNQLSAGTHRVRAVYRSMLGQDSLRLAALPQLPDPRGTAGVDTTRRAPTGQRGSRAPSTLQRNMITGGYLLLVATQAPLAYNAIRNRVEGETIPIAEEEALNAVAKAVRSTATPGASWSGYAVEVRVR